MLMCSERFSLLFKRQNTKRNMCQVLHPPFPSAFMRNIAKGKDTGPRAHYFMKSGLGGEVGGVLLFETKALVSPLSNPENSI